MISPRKLHLVGSAEEGPSRSDGDLNSGGGDGTFDDMEARVQKLEDAFLRVDRSLERIADDLGNIKTSYSRMEHRLDTLQSDVVGVRLSQGKIEERMERVMGSARDMPTESTISDMMNGKLTRLGFALTVVGALAGWLIKTA